MKNQTLQQAIQYAENGCRIFPAHTVINGKCSCGRNCKAPAKHPKIAGGFKSASSDINKISEWFSKDANIGMATGEPSNLIVIDVDKKNGGFDSLTKLEQKFGPISEHTLVANTGGDGLHIFYKHPGQVVRSRVHALGHGIDIRGDGGYVITSPAKHISGGVYRWPDGFHLPSSLPDDLLQELLKNPAKNGYSMANVIPKGQRNQVLTSIAGKLRARGQEVDEIEAELLQENSIRCRPPLSQSEVLLIASSISRYEPGTELIPFREYWLQSIYSETAQLDPNVKNTLAALYFCMNEDGGNCHPSQEHLSGRAGYGRRQTVSANLKKAQQLGWIRSFRIANQSNRGWHFGYIATVPAII